DEARATARRAFGPRLLEPPTDVVGRNVIHARALEGAQRGGEGVLHHSAASAPDKRSNRDSSPDRSSSFRRRASARCCSVRTAPSLRLVMRPTSAAPYPST